MRGAKGDFQVPSSGRISGSGSCNVSIGVIANRSGNREFLDPGEQSASFQVNFVIPK